MQDAVALDPDLVRSFEERIMDPWWRLTSGALYKIMTKAGEVVPFIPNALQVDFLQTMHNREVILKSRQIGFTTLISIYFLDHALFVPDQRCAQVATDLDKAMEIFRDKVAFAFDNLPPELRALFPVKSRSQTQLHFAHNNSMVYVDVSTRGGTPQRLHISEFGRISVAAPTKANEIVKGGFPSVPASGVIIIESTAEGQEGEFYAISNAAEARAKNPAPLQPLEWNFHFYAWWEHDDYQTDPEGVAISEEDHKYFNELEAKIVSSGKRPPGFKLNLRRRAWYVLYRKTTFSGVKSKMWPEMPSLPAEAWLRSPEGVFYADQLTDAVAERRIVPLPHASYLAVNTFWDIGSSDGTAVWLHQKVHPEHRFIRYVEGWFKPYVYFINLLEGIAQEHGEGWLWGTHYLPHDAMHERQQGTRVISPIDMLRELRPTWNWEIVPPVAELQHGIELTRKHFPEMWFNVDDAVEIDPEAEQAPDCRRGITHLWNYRKRRNTASGGWMDEPLKNGATEAADALRQFAQAYERVNQRTGRKTRPSRRGTEHML